MASELQWVHHFCLTCDKQTEGATYCSESCRLADYEEATPFSPPTSGPGSPSWAPTGVSTYPWTMGAPSARCRQLFSLTPAYDFANGQPYGSTPAASTRRSASTAATSNNFYSPALTLSLPPTTATTTATTTTSVTYQHVLSPSSSHSSLSSMRSGSSSGGALSALSAFANGSSSNSNSSQSTYGTSAASNNDLSERVRSELRKYASSLEQGKLQRQLQRRRSC